MHLAQAAVYKLYTLYNLNTMYTPYTLYLACTQPVHVQGVDEKLEPFLGQLKARILVGEKLLKLMGNSSRARLLGSMGRRRGAKY